MMSYSNCISLVYQIVTIDYLIVNLIPMQTLAFESVQRASLVPRPRGRREKWPGIHCLSMREIPHDFMGYRIPSFTNR